MAGERNKAKPKQDTLAWVTTVPGRPSSCWVCNQPDVAASLDEILAAMESQAAYHVTAPRILERLRELHPKARLTVTALHRHLQNHRGDQWRRARGIQ